MHSHSRGRAETCASPHELISTNNVLWENCAAHQHQSEPHHLSAFDTPHEFMRSSGSRTSNMWRDEVPQPRADDGFEAFLNDPQHHQHHDSCPHMLSWNDNMDVQMHHQVTNDLTPPPDASGPISPYSGDWPTETSHESRSRGSAGKTTLTPLVESFLSATKGDGVRKKNAKIDIPVGHDLTNLDKLIKEASKANDHAQEKELKQQKRLLRNREAALHSRQKKKEYTARLEMEKEHQQSELRQLKQRVDELSKQTGDQKQKGDRDYHQMRVRAREIAAQRQEFAIKNVFLQKENERLKKKCGILQSSSSSEYPSEVNTSSAGSEWDRDVDFLSMVSMDGLSNTRDLDKIETGVADDDGGTLDAKAICNFLLYYGAHVASGRSSSKKTPSPPLPAGVVGVAQLLSDKMAKTLTSDTDEKYLTQVDHLMGVYSADKPDAALVFSEPHLWANVPSESAIESVLKGFPSVARNEGQVQIAKALRDLVSGGRGIKSEL